MVAPRAPDLWIGVLFAVGAACFALGALPGYVDAVGPSADGITFFVGSTFFTSASYLQYRESGDGATLSWRPRQPEWVAAAVQLAGTLFFNVSTFHAMEQSLSTTQYTDLVWRADAFGSICFLVSGAIAWYCVAHLRWSRQTRLLPWWIAGLNLLGSIAFGVSAAAAMIASESDQVRNVALMNLGTFVRALGFLIAAILLLPERTLAEGSPATA